MDREKKKFIRIQKKNIFYNNASVIIKLDFFFFHFFFHLVFFFQRFIYFYTYFFSAVMQSRARIRSEKVARVKKKREKKRVSNPISLNHRQPGANSLDYDSPREKRRRTYAWHICARLRLMTVPNTSPNSRELRRFFFIYFFLFFFHFFSVFIVYCCYLHWSPSLLWTFCDVPFEPLAAAADRLILLMSFRKN